ncbi:MAG: pyridoxamine 5'-phosphate oxidase family protein [bacterium]|nr:pyridoxamine 5'-phosphate oxidase family protein [bacterium]
MSAKLVEYFNTTQAKLGTLSTANKAGKVNVAHFGTPHMIDENTIVMGVGQNRTFANLQENPNAVFMIMEPGEAPPEWHGARIYLTMTACETSGETVERIRNKVAEAAGENAAKMIHAAVIFEINEIRPVADFGQGWEHLI